jgi:hypothetical protein
MHTLGKKGSDLRKLKEKICGQRIMAVESEPHFAPLVVAQPRQSRSNVAPVL